MKSRSYINLVYARHSAIDLLAISDVSEICDAKTFEGMTTERNLRLLL